MQPDQRPTQPSAPAPDRMPVQSPLNTQPQPAMPPSEKSKRPLLVTFLTLLGVIALVGLTLLGVWLYEANQPKFNYSGPIGDDVTAPQNDKDDEIDLDVDFSDVGNTEKPLVWEFPTKVEGWNAKSLDKNGVNELLGDNGCTFSSFHGKFTKGSGNDKNDSKKQAEANLTSLNADLTLERIQPVKSAVGTVNFYRYDSTYSDENDQTYQSRFLVRVHNRRSSIMTLQYTCPLKEFTEKEWGNLFGRVLVVGDAKG